MPLITTIKPAGANAMAKRFAAVQGQVEALMPQPSYGVLTARTTRGVVRTVQDSVWNKKRNQGNVPRWA